MAVDDMMRLVTGEVEARIGETRGEDRFTVDFAQPLPQFDTQGAHAFLAVDPDRAADRFVALIGQIEVPRREHVIEALLKQPAHRVLSPLFDGVIEVEPGKNRTVTVIPMPGERVLVRADGSERVAEVVIRKVVAPQIAEALNELKLRNLSHRDIRWETIYWKDDRRTQIVLGECFSSPPGVHLRAEAEMAARSTVHHWGRGEGAMASDLAAAGYAMVVMILGKSPPIPMQGAALAQERAARNTAAVYLSGVSLSATLANLLRGLLADDPSAQWLPDQIKQWSAGGEPGVRPVNQLDQFLRPCKFGDGAHAGRRALARAFGAAPRAAAEFAKTEAFGKFANNGSSDQALTDKLKALLASSTVNTDLFVNKLRHLLDPGASVVLDHFEVMSDGLGPLLALAFAQDDQDMLKAFQSGFALGVFSSAAESDHPGFMNPRERRTQIAAIANYCKGDRGQNGLERVVYELNPGLACASPLVKDLCVRSIKDLLVALEMIARSGRLKGPIFDRHIEGFVAAHCAGSESRIELLARAKGDKAEELMAQIRVLESLQNLMFRAPMPALTQVLAEGLRDPIRKLKNKQRRDSSLTKLDSLASTGYFGEIARGIDLPALIERDRKEYKSAVGIFTLNLLNADILKTNVHPEDPKALEAGQRAVAVIAHSILGMSAFATLLRMFM